MFWLFGDDKPVPPRPEEEGTGDALREDEEPEKAAEDPDPEVEEGGQDPADGGSAETGGEEFELFSEESDADFQSGVFINSLDQLEEEDIPLSEHAAEAERVSVFEYLRRVMFWFFLAAFVVSMFLLIRNGIQKRKAAQIYREIQEEFFSAEESKRQDVKMDLEL